MSKFVLLSSIGADQSDPYGELAHYLKAKHDADEHLKAPGMIYASLRPVALSDDGRSAYVTVGDDVDPSASGSCADVAQLLVEATVTDQLDSQALDMQSA